MKENNIKSTVFYVIDWILITISAIIYALTLLFNENKYHQTGAIFICTSSIFSCCNYYLFNKPNLIEFNIKEEYDEILKNYRDNILTIFAVSLLSFLNSIGYNFNERENINYSIFLAYNGVFFYITFIYIICNSIKITREFFKKIYEIFDELHKNRDYINTSYSVLNMCNKINNVLFGFMPLRHRTSLFLITVLYLGICFSKPIYNMQINYYWFVLIQFFAFRWLISETISVAVWKVKYKN